MTPAQRQALDVLPPKRRAFAIAYVGEAAGNATAAARIAGYSNPTSQGSRLLTFVEVVSAIDAFRVPAERAAVASVEELREFWSSIARGEVDDVAVTLGGAQQVPASLTTRMRATELLGKSSGAFAADKAPPVTVGVQLVVTRETAIQVIEATREGEGR